MSGYGSMTIATSGTMKGIKKLIGRFYGGSMIILGAINETRWMVLANGKERGLVEVVIRENIYKFQFKTGGYRWDGQRKRKREIGFITEDLPGWNDGKEK